MDKSWMMESKYSANYVVGVSTFMDFVKNNKGSECKIRCPCRECVNVCFRSQNEVEDHLLLHGISESYTKWIYHGEQFEFTAGSGSSEGVAHDVEFLDGGLNDLLGDMFPIVDEDSTNHGFNFGEGEEEAKNFSKLLNDAQCLLLPGKHKMEIQLQSPLSVEERHRAQFPLWFKNYVTNQGSKGISREILSLAYGPDIRAQKYTGCIVNGVRFHTKARDEHLTSQNSGVTVEGNHEEDQINFYGILTDIIQLNYIKDYKVVLFKCKWFDLDNKKRRIHRDGHLLSINISKYWYESDPFILSVQAKQVFYLDDTKLGKDWKVVQKFHHRHLFDVPEMQAAENDDVSDADDDFEIYDSNMEMQISENISLHRNDIAANVIDCDIVDNVNILVNSDQESEDGGEGDEIESDEYDTDIEHAL
ncbi:hypothetical protein V6N11_081905 [Hibiscus sabdariffa]|uniref:Transposase-associated domain-containing protein n=1 Tax=Hibiscus sabdariffa TaxID=183260 RepID=A0ABR2Q7J1_9ROSI